MHIATSTHRPTVASCIPPIAPRATAQTWRTPRAAASCSTSGEHSTWQAAPQLLTALAAAAVLTGGGVPAAWAAVPPTSQPGTNVGECRVAMLDGLKVSVRLWIISMHLVTGSGGGGPVWQHSSGHTIHDFGCMPGISEITSMLHFVI